MKNKKAKDIKQKIFFVPKDVDEHLGTNHKYKIAKFPKVAFAKNSFLFELLVFSASPKAGAQARNSGMV